MSHRHVLRILAALVALPSLAVLPPQAAIAQTIPTFSGADGAAGNITGGRGGIVYHVTKLDQNYSDAVPGTLRYGLSDGNFPVGTKRTLVFDVGGTFWLGRFGAEQGHDNGWDTNSRINLGSNVTVAGQTAPGPVYIMGGLVKASSANAILRNVSIAPGYGMRNFEKPDDVPPVIPFGGDATHTRDFPDSYVYDAIDISAANQLMIDHVSTFYSTDETISANELGNNVTIQYSNISQGQNYPQADAEASGIIYTGHALGSLLQGGTDTKFSIHHNLYAHQKGRLPRVGSEVGTGAYNDFRNNVFYNWLSTAGGGASGQPSFNNFVGNFYLAGPGGDNVAQANGPDGQSGTADDVVTVVNSSGGTSVFSGSNSTGTRVFQSGNLRDINKDGDANDGAVLTNSNFSSSSIQASPQWVLGQPTYTGVTDTATDAFTRVLKYMGANWWTRDFDFTAGNTAAIDTVDERIIHETYTGTGKIKAWADNPFNDYPVPPAGFDPYDPNEGAEWRGLLALRADTVTGAAPFNRGSNWDTDLDGMPNEWEQRHGLNPSVAENNGDFDGDGYTNVEEYINELAAWPAASAVVFNNAHADGRYAHILNWDENPDAVTVQAWQPSKYDTAVVDNGTVVVDAVGQHAGNLLLATNPGDNATLNITSGWLKVEDAPQGLSDGAVVIGDSAAATAALNLSGGKLTTKSLLKSAGGSFNFTGGVLSAETVGFDLVNNGGTIAPGSSPGMTHVMGDLTVNSGVIEIEIGGTDLGDYDQLVVDGATTLGGMLKVLAIDLGEGVYVPELGDEFALVASQNGFDGMFSGFELPDLAAGLEWVLMTDEMLLSLAVIEATVGLAGDYNGDHVVDAADYSMWRDSLGGTTLLNETASLGFVDQEDYDAWKANFGATDGEGAGSTAAVPEPATMALLLIATVAMFFVRRRGG